MKFHINAKGEAGSCKAVAGNCPFGDDSKHYASPEAAREAYEVSMGAPQPLRREAQAAPLAPEDPTPEDWEDAYSFVLNHNLALPGAPRWDNTMGADARRTKANVARFHALRRDWVDNNPTLRRHLEEQAKKQGRMRSYARRFHGGVEGPREREVFDRLWSDPTNYSGGEIAVRKRFEELLETEARFKRGEITPRSIVGTGYNNPREVASEYLRKQLSEYNQMIASSGRYCTENVRKAERELARSEELVAG